MTTRLRPLAGLFFLLSAALLCLTLLLPDSAHAQEASDATAAETPAETAPPAEEDAAPEGPAYPAGLASLDMGLEEFVARLIPLTVDELSALAADWQGIAKAQTQAVVDASIDARSKDGGATPEELEQITALTDTRGEGFDRLTAVVNNLEAKGGDPDEVAGYRAYRAAIVVSETQQADLESLMYQTLDWAVDPDGGIQVLINVATVIASFIGLVIAARIVRRYVRRLLTRVPNMSRLLEAFLAMAVYWLTLSFGLLVVLSALGVNITPLFALVGGASFVLAFAMQDTLSNLAAGLMILFNRPFDEGDYITAGGTAGTVKNVSVVSTTVTTPDNQVIVVPNSRIWGDVIVNATTSDTRRVDLVFGIDYGDDADLAMETILKVADADARVLKTPEPWVRVTNLGDSSVDLTTRIWCRADDYWELKFALTKDVKQAFDQSGISIPYPHTVEITKAG